MQQVKAGLLSKNLVCVCSPFPFFLLFFFAKSPLSHHALQLVYCPICAIKRLPFQCLVIGINIKELLLIMFGFYLHSQHETWPISYRKFRKFQLDIFETAYFFAEHTKFIQAINSKILHWADLYYTGIPQLQCNTKTSPGVATIGIS